MYLAASILFLVAVFWLMTGLITLVAAVSRKQGTVYPLAFGLCAAYIAAYLAFIY